MNATFASFGADPQNPADLANGFPNDFGNDLSYYAWRNYEVHAVSTEELSKALDRIRKIKGIENTETSIHLVTFARPG